MKCKQCGSQVPAGAYKCPICGVILPLTKTKASDVFKWDVEDFPSEEANLKKVSIDWDGGKILDRGAGRVFDQTQSHWSVTEIDADPEESGSDPAGQSSTQQTRPAGSRRTEGDSGTGSSLFGWNLRNSVPLFDWSGNSEKKEAVREAEGQETPEESRESYTEIVMAEDAVDEPVQEPVPEVKERRLSRKEKREQRRAERKKQQEQKAQASRENDIFDIPDSMKMGRFDSFLRDDYDVELVIPGEQESEDQYFTLIKGVGPVVRPPDETEVPQKTETRKKISISTEEFDWSREAEENVANRRRLAEERRQLRKNSQDDPAEPDDAWNHPEDAEDDHGWKSENTFRKVVSIDATSEFHGDAAVHGNRDDYADTAGAGQNEMEAGRFLVSRRKKQAEADTIELNMDNYDDDLTPTERSMMDRTQRKHEDIGGSDLSVLSLEDEYENFHNTIDYMDIEPEYLQDDSFRNVVIPDQGRNVNIRIDNGDGTTVSVRTNAVDPYEADRNAKVSTREIDIHELRNRMKNIELSVEVSTTSHDEVEVLQSEDGLTAVRTGEPRQKYDRIASGTFEKAPSEEPALDEMSEGERFWANTEYPDNSNRMTITDIFGPGARHAMENSGRKKTKKKEGSSILDIQPEDIELTRAQTEQLYTPTSRDDLAGIAAADELATRDPDRISPHSHTDGSLGTGRTDSVVHYENDMDRERLEDSNLYDEISIERDRPLKKRRPDGGLRDGQDRKTIHRVEVEVQETADIDAATAMSAKNAPTSEKTAQKTGESGVSVNRHDRPGKMASEEKYEIHETEGPEVSADTETDYYGSPVQYFETEMEPVPEFQETEVVTFPVEEAVSEERDDTAAMDGTVGEMEDTASVEGLKTSFRKRFSSFRNRFGGGKTSDHGEDARGGSEKEDRKPHGTSASQIDWAATMDAVEKNSRKETVLPVDAGDIQDDWTQADLPVGVNGDEERKDIDVSSGNPQDEILIEEYEWSEAEIVDDNWPDADYEADVHSVYAEETVSEDEPEWSGEVAYAEYAELLQADAKPASHDFSGAVRGDADADAEPEDNPEWLNAYSDLYSASESDPEVIEEYREIDVTEAEPVTEATDAELIWFDEPEIIEEYEYYEYEEVTAQSEPEYETVEVVEAEETEGSISEVIEAEEPDSIEITEAEEPDEITEPETALEAEKLDEDDPEEVTEAKPTMEEAEPELTLSDAPEAFADNQAEAEWIPEESEEVTETGESEIPTRTGAYDAFEYYYEYYEEELIPEGENQSDVIEIKEETEPFGREESEASAAGVEPETSAENAEPKEPERQREETEELIRARIYEEELYEEALEEADVPEAIEKSENSVDEQTSEEANGLEEEIPEEPADEVTAEDAEEPEIEPETYAEYEYDVYEEEEIPEEPADEVTAEDTEEPEIEPETYAEYEYDAYEEEEILEEPAGEMTAEDAEEPEIEPETYAEYEYDVYEEEEIPEEPADEMTAEDAEDAEEPEIEPETYAEYEYDVYEEEEIPEEPADEVTAEDTEEPEIEPETYAEYEYDAYEREEEIPEEPADEVTAEDAEEPEIGSETYAEYEYDAYEEEEILEEPADEMTAEDAEEPEIGSETYAKYEYDAYEEEEIPEEPADEVTAEDAEEPEIGSETYAEYEYDVYEEEEIPERPASESVSRVIPLHGFSSQQDAESLSEREPEDISLFDEDYDFMKQKPENTISFDAVALNQYRKADEELARTEEEDTDWTEPDFFGTDHTMSSDGTVSGQPVDGGGEAEAEDEGQNTGYMEWNGDLPELSIFESPSRPRRVEAAETLSHGADARTRSKQGDSAVSADGAGRTGMAGLRNRKKRTQADSVSEERARRAEDLRSILEREEEGSGGFSPLLKAAITVLIVLIAIEFSIIAVKLFAPESKPAGVIHQVEQRLSGKSGIQSPDRRTEMEQETLRLSDGSLVGMDQNIHFRS